MASWIKAILLLWFKCGTFWSIGSGKQHLGLLWEWRRQWSFLECKPVKGGKCCGTSPLPSSLLNVTWLSWFCSQCSNPTYSFFFLLYTLSIPLGPESWLNSPSLSRPKWVFVIVIVIVFNVGFFWSFCCGVEGGVCVCEGSSSKQTLVPACLSFFMHL